MSTKQNKKITLSDVKAANEMYFAKGQKCFFGDISYSLINVNGKPYLRTYTNGWSDTFTGQKSAFYTAKPIDKETLQIGSRVERNGKFKFIDKDILKDYLKTL